MQLFNSLLDSRAILVLGVGAFAAVGNFSLTTEAAAIPLQNASATFEQSGFPISAAIDGDTTANNGWALFDERTQNQTGVFQTTTSVSAASLEFDLNYTSQYQYHKAQEFRLSYTTDSNPSASGSNTWIQLTPSSAFTTSGLTPTINGDNTILISGNASLQAEKDNYIIDVNVPVANVTGFRLELFAVDQTGGMTPNPTIGFPTGNGNEVLTEFTVTATPEPASLGLIGFTSIGVLSRRRRR